ncbi:hypothetical protein HK102_007452, partial [Quaeritorhiza haematococci]
MDGFDAPSAEAGGPSADAGGGWERPPGPTADEAANWGGGGRTSPIKAVAAATGGWDSVPIGDEVGASDWALPSGAAAAHNDWEVSGAGDGGGYDAGYSGRGGGGGTRSCFNRGSTDHMSRESTEPRKPKEDKSLFYGGSAEHLSKNSLQKAADKRPRKAATPEELERLWEAVKMADKMMEIDDIREAVLEYVKNDPNETWENIERKLRDAGCKLSSRIALFTRNSRTSRVLVTKVLFTCSSRNIKKKLKDEAAYAENMKNLVDAGILCNRSKVDGKYVLPEWATGHLTSEQLVVASGGYKCGAMDHKGRDCTQVEPEWRATKPRTVPMKILHLLSLVRAADRKATKQWIVMRQTPDLHSLAINVTKKAMRRWIVRSLTEGAPSLAEAVETSHKASDCPDSSAGGHKQEDGGGYEGYGSHNTTNNADGAAWDTDPAPAAMDNSWDTAPVPQASGGD